VFFYLLYCIDVICCPVGFCRTMLCKCSLCHHAASVRLSIRHIREFCQNE